MLRPYKISYNFSGNETDYKSLLRKFRLDTLLRVIGGQSSVLMRGLGKAEASGTQRVKIPVTPTNTMFAQTQEVLMTAWDLIDLAYEAIMATNDHRGIEKLEDGHLPFLVLATQEYREKQRRSYNQSPKERRSSDIILFLWGFVGEQFRMQAPAEALSNASRDLHLLINISQQVTPELDIPNIVLEEVGATWLNVVAALYALWANAMYNHNIEGLVKSIHSKSNDILEDFLKILSRYTATYQEVRDSSLGRQVLYTKPIIKTSRGELINVGCYLTLYQLEHCIQWIIREALRKQSRDDFPSLFGQYFEAYFEEMLHLYVEEDNFEKLPEGTQKSADWRLTLGNYHILIEQKSSILPIAAKQQNPDIEAIRKFIWNTFPEAIFQLHTTEQVLHSGNYIKIVLLYEDYYKGWIPDDVFQESSIANDGLYWVVRIDEMETLLYQYKHHRGRFDSVMAEKLRLETSKSPERTDFHRLLAAAGVRKNKHMQRAEFKYFSELAQDTAASWLSPQ